MKSPIPMAHALADLFERVLIHLTVPETALPKQYRVSCLPCGDRGIEAYWPPEKTWLRMPYRTPYMRPCTHCGRGVDVMEQWTRRPKPGASFQRGHSRTEVEGGPYFQMSPADIAEITGCSCAHDERGVVATTTRR